jgi:hypothetical protein
METIRKIDIQVSGLLNKVSETIYVKAVLHLLLVLYAARLAPEIPQVVADLFGNTYFKLLIFSLILWTAQISPSTSILITLAFMVTLNHVNKKPLWEFLDNVDAATKIVTDAVPAAVLSANPTVSTAVVASIKAAIPVAIESAIKTGDVKDATSQALQAIQAPVAVQSQAQAPVEEQAKKEEQSGCYPVRKVDMTKVGAFEGEDYGLVQ